MPNYIPITLHGIDKDDLEKREQFREEYEQLLGKIIWKHEGLLK